MCELIVRAYTADSWPVIDAWDCYNIVAEASCDGVPTPATYQNIETDLVRRHAHPVSLIKLFTAGCKGYARISLVLKVPIPFTACLS